MKAFDKIYSSDRLICSHQRMIADHHDTKNVKKIEWIKKNMKLDFWAFFGSDVVF